MISLPGSIWCNFGGLEHIGNKDWLPCLHICADGKSEMPPSSRSALPPKPPTSAIRVFFLATLRSHIVFLQPESLAEALVSVALAHANRVLRGIGFDWIELDWM